MMVYLLFCIGINQSEKWCFLLLNVACTMSSLRIANFVLSTHRLDFEIARLQTFKSSFAETHLAHWFAQNSEIHSSTNK